MSAAACRLVRRVRAGFSLDGGLASDLERPAFNPTMGWPVAEGMALWIEVSVSVQGVPDPVTGYLAGISEIDECVRAIVFPPIIAALAPSADERSPMPRPALLLRSLLREAPGRLLQAPSRGSPTPNPGADDPPALRVPAASIRLNPRLTYHMLADLPDRVLLRQEFEFAASHRLHCASLSDERNAEIFGKCNNPHGHGHNYRLEVVTECPLSSEGVAAPGVHDIHAVVRTEVIDRLDHRHLNLDVPEFRTANPSVEHITAVIHRLLAAPIAAVGGTLRSVTVWETAKTSCSIPAEAGFP